MYGKVTRWRLTGSVDGQLPDKMEKYTSKYPRSNQKYNPFDKAIIGELINKFGIEKIRETTCKWNNWDVIEEIVRAAIAIGRTSKSVVWKINYDYQKKQKETQKEAENENLCNRLGDICHYSERNKGDKD